MPYEAAPVGCPFSRGVRGFVDGVRLPGSFFFGARGGIGWAILLLLLLLRAATTDEARVEAVV